MPEQKWWSQNKWLLVIGNIILGGVFVTLWNSRLLPFDPVNFVFFSSVVFLAALYRPGWAFLFLVGMLPYETVILTPAGFPFAMRPYQWLALLLAVALSVRFLTQRLPFKLIRLRWFDGLLLCIPLGGLVAAFQAPVPSLAIKQALVLFSFGLVYAMIQQFVRTLDDLRHILPFVFGSSAVVIATALWQNLRFASGRESFEVMAGRPNATFTEADWLGLFALLLLTLFFSLSETVPDRLKPGWLGSLGIFVAESLTLVILLISVSRSAWLAALMAGIVCLVATGLSDRVSAHHTIRNAGRVGGLMAGAFGLALLLVLGFHLTTFNLFQRAESSVSGLQKITVSCESTEAVTKLPQTIRAETDLSALGCRHIDLEAIGAETALGRSIGETMRDDPTIGARKSIFGQVISLIRSRPVLGIGWGSDALLLGTDGRGVGLNASNMFLEVWLGSGLLGLVAFVVFWGALAVGAGKELSRAEDGWRTLSLFLITAWSGVTVFNLFNSGLLLGYFFLFLAVGTLTLERLPAPWPIGKTDQL